MLRERTSNIHYSSIDEILGDSRKRFFGAGFRQVRQRIRDVRVDAREERAIHASAHIVYPASWSTKKGRELVPHLSSVDALVIGAQLCEAYIRHAYGLEGPSADRVWLRRAVLKAGNTPTLDLAAVPSHCTLVKTERSSDSLCGHLSYFVGRIGSIAVELVLDHLAVSPRDAVARHADLIDLLGPPEQRYYGSAYTATSSVLRDIELDLSRRSGRMSLDLEHPADHPQPRGMGAAHFPFVSGVLAIVCVAQLAQAMLYAGDGIAREATNTLWMRKIVINSPQPVAAGPGLLVDTWCSKTSLLPVKETVWRSSSFGVTLPGIEGEYNVAHQLPQR